MKKRELVHLHDLLAEVSNYFEQRIGDSLVIDEYEEMNVRPTSIHKGKTDHKNAVLTLAKGLNESEDVKEMPEDMKKWEWIS